MILTFFIFSQPVNDNYGNPSSIGEIALPDSFLSDYINAKGFVIPVIENGTVVSMTVNQSALDAYNAEHPEVEPEPETVPLTEEETQEYLADLDFRICLLELGLSEEDL